MTTLAIQLKFYTNNVITMTRYVGDGTVTHPVTAAQIATVLDKTRQRVSSGWLPPNILNWSIEADNRVRCVAHFEATIVAVHVSDEAEPWQLPMPPTVMIGHGQSWRIYAYQETETIAPDTTLCHCPAPNVSASGGNICQGNTPFPKAAPKTMAQAYAVFWGSQFNAHWSTGKCHSHPDNVLDLWRTLKGKAVFPSSELIPTRQTVNSVLK